MTAHKKHSPGFLAIVEEARPRVREVSVAEALQASVLVPQPGRQGVVQQVRSVQRRNRNQVERRKDDIDLYPV